MTGLSAALKPAIYQIPNDFGRAAPILFRRCLQLRERLGLHHHRHSMREFTARRATPGLFFVVHKNSLHPIFSMHIFNSSEHETQGL